MYEEKRYRPLSPWAYFGYSLLFAIPLVGLILLIILSFSAKNINLKNYARSYFCKLALILIVVGVIILLTIFGVLTKNIVDLITDFAKQIKFF